MFLHFIRICLLLLLASPSLATAGPFKGMSFGLGGATGVDFLEGSAIGSPMISVGLEAGGENVRFYFDVDSAPTFEHSFNGWDSTWPMFMITMGPSFGTQDIRVGPIVTFGALDVGGGVRVQATPWKDKAGGSHGFEFRACYLPAETAQIALLYTWRPTWGVRKGPGKKKKNKGKPAAQAQPETELDELGSSPAVQEPAEEEPEVPAEAEEADAEEETNVGEEAEGNVDEEAETESGAEPESDGEESESEPANPSE